MSMFKRNKKWQAGFTLLEMLVVIAIIAGLAALIVPMFGNVSEKAASAEDASNQAGLTRQVFGFAELNGGEYPDIMDSLLEATYDSTTQLFDGTSTGDLYGDLYVTVGSMGSKLGIASPFDLALAVEGGSNAWDTTYTVGQIMYHGLGKLKIKYVVDHYDADETAPANEEPEFPNESTNKTIERKFSAGMPPAPLDHVVILNTVSPYPVASVSPDDLPAYVVDIYDHFGLDLPVDASGDLTGNAWDGDIVVLFGFGNRNTAVGNVNGGVHDSPFSTAFNTTEYYSRYIAMFKMPKAMGGKAEFLGVLGGNGYPTWKSHQAFASN
ncbi:MAG: type II secretion system GspH family protein [Candidatus Omnitrophica bacterium]|nr:type II secretion system GspH family protein [Candidatus Omnitrophota bacterium]